MKLNVVIQGISEDRKMVNPRPLQHLEGIQNGEKLAKETNEEQPVWQEEIWERMCPESHIEKLCQKYGRKYCCGFRK